mgnify:CR=1 FL=1|jgi:hypothetical protein
MNDRRAMLAILGALSAVGALLADAPQTRTIEDARRELEKLPPTSGEAVPENWPRVDVPTISVETPPSSTRSRKPNAQEAEAETEKSEGWLVDGVQQLAEEERRAKQKEFQRTSDNDRASEETREDAHPFNEYMARWLTPADRAALSGLSGSPVSDVGLTRNASQRTSGSSRLPETQTQERLPNPGAVVGGNYQATPARNPYLEDMPGATIPAPMMNSSGATGASSFSPASASANVPSASKATAPTTTERAEELPSPTERLIDDRKYFPQLRRF